MNERRHAAKKSMVLVLGFVFSFGLASCTPLVKTDLQSFNDHPEEYKGKELIFTADIKSVVEHPEAYTGKQVELKGYVTYNGFRGFVYWNFLLKDDEGLSLRCYEDEYRVDVWNWPDMVVKGAERRREQMAVVGKFEQGRGVELRWIEYDGQTISTDYKPPSIVVPFF